MLIVTYNKGDNNSNEGHLNGFKNKPAKTHCEKKTLVETLMCKVL